MLSSKSSRIVTHTLASLIAATALIASGALAAHRVQPLIATAQSRPVAATNTVTSLAALMSGKCRAEQGGVICSQ